MTRSVCFNRIEVRVVGGNRLDRMFDLFFLDIETFVVAFQKARMKNEYNESLARDAITSDRMRASYLRIHGYKASDLALAATSLFGKSINPTFIC